MIVEDQKVEVAITRRNMNIYMKLGYTNLKVGEAILVDIQDLPRGSHAKVKVQCDYCKKIIDVVYKDYVAYKFDKYSCVHCRQKKTSEYNLKQRQKKLYERALSFCNEMGYALITPIDDILNAETRVIYKCPKHGLRETKIYTLIDKHECLECSYEHRASQQRKTPEEVYNDFKQCGGILLNKEDYREWNCKNLRVICECCGEVFVTSYCAFMQHNGQRCSKCASTISRGEYAIKQYLETNRVRFYMQFRFDDCRTKVPLPFDFYLPEYNLLIEYDGEGHYMPIKRGDMTDIQAEETLNSIKYRDAIKNTYCEENNIRLLRIPYWEFDDITQILHRELFT